MMDAAPALGTSPGRRPSRLPAHQGKVWPKRDQVGTEDRLVTGGWSGYILGPGHQVSGPSEPAGR